MKHPTYISIIPFLISLIGCVESLRVVINDPTATETDTLIVRQAERDANIQLTAMNRALRTPDDAYNKNAIKKSFGPNANIQRIKALVVLMMNHGTVNIPTMRSASADQQNANAMYMGPNSMAVPEVVLRTNFYTGGTPKSRAGTLIHEASHGYGATCDNWVERQPGDFICVDHTAAVRTTPGAFAAYYHTPGFQTLKTRGSVMTYQNADSYIAFGAFAAYGLPPGEWGRTADGQRIWRSSSKPPGPSSGRPQAPVRVHPLPPQRPPVGSSASTPKKASGSKT